jgi:hypothetical protein
LHNPGQPLVRPVQEVGLHDQQQALVLGALRRASGTPVSFAELREAGVEFPASVVSELELAGVPIERCRGVEGRGASVRLDPAFEPTDEPTAEAERPATTRALPPIVEDGPRGNPARHRLLVPIALLAVIVAVGALLATSLGGSGGPAKPRVVRRPHPKPAISASIAPTTAKTPPAPPPPPPTPVSLGLARRLESRGHGLLQNGSYSGAVAVLRRALLATGEDVGACVQPASTMCLTYAYALYDLGRALRLSGDPAAAVPILERRLEIDNQRPTVLAELELARRGTT